MTPPRRSSAIRQHSSSAFLPHPLGVRPRRQVDHSGEAVDIQFLSLRVSHIERGNCALQRSFERRERSRDAGRADTFTRADPHARRLEATFATEATSAPAVGDAEPGHHATMPATCVFDSRLIPAERPLPGVAKNVDQVLAKPWAVGHPSQPRIGSRTRRWAEPRCKGAAKRWRRHPASDEWPENIEWVIT